MSDARNIAKIKFVVVVVVMGLIYCSALFESWLLFQFHFPVDVYLDRL